MQAINLTNSSKENKRRDLDFYPTPPNVTQALMQFLHDEQIICPFTVIWEPACGNGIMSKEIEKFGHKVLSTDIRNTGYGQGEVDFLGNITLECGAIITNPPFAPSVQFINKSMVSAPITAFLLKSQYWHAENKTELFKRYPPAYILALNWRPDFMDGERGGSPTMECIWTIWIEGQTDTKYKLLEKPGRKNKVTQMAIGF